MRIFSQQRACAPLLMPPTLAALLRTLPEFAPGALSPLPLLQLSSAPSTPRPRPAWSAVVPVAGRPRRRCRPAGVPAPAPCVACMHPPRLNTPHAHSFRAARSPSRAPLTGGIAPTPPAGSAVPLGAGFVGFTNCADTHAAGPGCCLLWRSGMDIGRKWCLRILGVRFMLPRDCSVRAEAGAHVQREHARRLPLGLSRGSPRVGASSRATAALPRWTGGAGSFVRDMRRKATPAFLGRVWEVSG
ncbi:hypothetical protein B0H14DRAFT_2939882 [Mycena olivaceomarginata]|nr:hypothetical protein B0H14DRAFT_2939882 [Mycena olivaceomarginata]